MNTKVKIEETLEDPEGLLTFWNQFVHKAEELSPVVVEKVKKEDSYDPSTKTGRTNLSKKLGEACINKDVKSIKHWIELGADVNKHIGTLRNSPLNWAIENIKDDMSVLEYLLSLGADATKDYRSYKWKNIENAIGVAIATHNKEAIECMVRHGVSMRKEVDTQSEYPLHTEGSKDLYLDLAMSRPVEFQYWWFQRFYDNDLNLLLKQFNVKTLVENETGLEVLFQLDSFFMMSPETRKCFCDLFNSPLSSDSIKVATKMIKWVNQDERHFELKEGKLHLLPRGIRELWSDALVSGSKNKIENMKELIELGWVIDPVSFKEDILSFFWEVVEVNSLEVLKSLLASHGIVQKINAQLSTDPLTALANITRDFKEWSDREEPFLAIQCVLSTASVEAIDLMLGAGVRLQDLQTYHQNNVLHIRGKRDQISNSLISVLVKHNIAEQLGDQKNDTAETPFEVGIVGYRSSYQPQSDIEKKKAFYEDKTIRKLFRKKLNQDQAEINTTVKRSIKRKRM